MVHLIREHTTDPPPRPTPSMQPDTKHAARCYQALVRQQSICTGLRRAIRREHDRMVKRRLRFVLRQAERRERAALLAYRRALHAAARHILMNHYPGYHPE